MITYFTGRESNIYFIGPATRACVKIGTSRKPERRLAQLQMVSAARLEMYALVGGRMCDELLIHRRLKDYRIVGEWFRLEGVVEDLLAAIITTNALPPEFVMPPNRDVIHIGARRRGPNKRHKSFEETSKAISEAKKARNAALAPEKSAGRIELNRLLGVAA